MRLTVFTVHAPPGTPQAQENLVFIKDRFSFWAFLAPFIWLMYRRNWRALAVYFAVNLLLSAFAAWAGFGPAVMFVPILLMGLYVGLEAAALRQGVLHRQGYHQIASVLATSEREAEQRYYTLTLPPHRMMAG